MTKEKRKFERDETPTSQTIFETHSEVPLGWITSHYSMMQMLQLEKASCYSTKHSAADKAPKASAGVLRIGELTSSERVRENTRCRATKFAGQKREWPRMLVIKRMASGPSGLQ